MVLGVSPIHVDIVQTAAVGIGFFLPPLGVGLLMALRFAEVPVSRHAPTSEAKGVFELPTVPGCPQLSGEVGWIAVDPSPWITSLPFCPKI